MELCIALAIAALARATLVPGLTWRVPAVLCRVPANNG